jgi:uncharacterized protein (TIGR02266 family)
MLQFSTGMGSHRVMRGGAGGDGGGDGSGQGSRGCEVPLLAMYGHRLHGTAAEWRRGGCFVMGGRCMRGFYHTFDDQELGMERRLSRRVTLQLDANVAEGENFLFSYITNLSVQGIFLRSEDPLPPGTVVRLTFRPPGGGTMALEGEVRWINPVIPDAVNPHAGMGIRFVRTTPEQEKRLLDLVQRVAYLGAEEVETSPV